MFSWKSLLSLFAGSLVFVSCAPSPPVVPQIPGAQPVAVDPQNPGGVPKTPAQIEAEKKEAARIKANAEAKARREALAKENETTENDQPSDPTPPREVVTPSSKYRTAMAIPGKPGYVFNPWTNKSVDVRGIPSGTLIRDPNDGNPDHKFRVP